MNVLILLAFAIAPGVCIATFIYLKDKHEREPIGLLFQSFLHRFFSPSLASHTLSNSFFFNSFDAC